MSIGVPIKVLHEAEGHIVTLETIMGELYRGKLVEAEDNMNCLMGNITVTYRDGRTAQLEQVYIRGSKIRFLILPDMLKNAPMFKNIKGTKATQGRGKTAIIRASVNKTRGGGRAGATAAVPGRAGAAAASSAPGNLGAGRSRGTNVYQKK
jgi:small nuclear ribonucleoprotein D3